MKGLSVLKQHPDVKYWHLCLLASISLPSILTPSILFGYSEIIENKKSGRFFSIFSLWISKPVPPPSAPSQTININKEKLLDPFFLYCLCTGFCMKFLWPMVNEFVIQHFHFLCSLQQWLEHWLWSKVSAVPGFEDHDQKHQNHPNKEGNRIRMWAPHHHWPPHRRRHKQQPWKQERRLHIHKQAVQQNLTI